MTTTRRILLDDPTLPAFLRARLIGCGKPVGTAWGYCRELGCHRCRAFRATAWATEATKLFRRCPERRLRNLDIPIGLVGRAAEIKPILRSIRMRLRNVVANLRRKHPAACALTVLGAFTVAREAGCWRLNLRAVLDLGGLHELRLLDQLGCRWPGQRRPMLRPMRHGDIPDTIVGLLEFPSVACWDEGPATELFPVLAASGNFAAPRFKLRASGLSREK